MSADDDSQAGESEAAEGQSDAMRRMESRLDGIHEYVEQLEERIGDLEAANESLRQELADERDAREHAEGELSRRLDKLDERTDLLQLVERVEAADGKQRSAALLQHIKRKARRNGRDGGASKAIVDRDDADEALHYPDIDRTTLYSDLERVKTWIGDEDVCWYDDGELWLDLSAANGSLPRPADIRGRSTTGSTGATGEMTLNQTSEHKHG